MFVYMKDVHATDKEHKAATEVLEMGERFAEQCGSHYMKWELTFTHLWSCKFLF